MQAALDHAREPSEHQVAVALAAARDARRGYDRLMAQAVFGYQPSSWYRRGEQRPTTRAMTSSMRDFADRVLLESKIPASFTQARHPAEIWEKLRRKYYPRLEG